MHQETEKEEVKQPKKRGRKPNPNKPDKNYWGSREEDAFKEYIASKDPAFRNRVFRDILYPAFSRMVEAIIRRYFLFTPDEPFEVTFNDAMSFLLTKVENYDPNKKCKVYSYCGTIIKNYCILKRENGKKKQKRVIPYDGTCDETSESSQKVMTDTNVDVQFNEQLISKVIDNINSTLKGPNSKKLSEDEMKVGMALIELLSNWEDIFELMDTKKYNKTNVLYYIKEHTFLSTTEVRSAMKKFKIMYFDTKEDFINE